MDERGSAEPGTVARGAVLTFAGSLFQLGVSLLSGLIVARALGPAAYGIFNLARTWCETTTLMTKFGFDLGVVRYLGERGGRTPDSGTASVLRRILLIVALLSTLPVVWLAIGGAAWLEHTVYTHAGFAWVIALLALAIPFMSLTQVLGGICRSMLRFAPRVAVELVAQPALRLALIVILFSMGWSLGGVIAASVISFVAATLLLLFILRATLLNTTTSDRRGAAAPGTASQATWAVARYSAGIALTVIVTAVMQRADMMVLGVWVDAAALGQYALAQMVVATLALFNGALNQGLAPLLAGYHRAGDRDAMRRIVAQHGRWVILTTLPFYVVLMLFGNDFLAFISAEFRIEWRVLALLSSAQFVAAVLSSSGFVLSMTGHHRHELGIMTIGMLVALTLCIVFVPQGGLAAAAAAGCAAVVATNVLRAWYVYHLFGFVPLGREVVPPLVLGGAAATGLILMARVFSDVAGPGGALVWSFGFILLYSAVMLRFGLSSDDKTLLAGVMSRVRARGER